MANKFRKVPLYQGLEKYSIFSVTYISLSILLPVSTSKKKYLGLDVKDETDAYYTYLVDVFLRQIQMKLHCKQLKSDNQK